MAAGKPNPPVWYFEFRISSFHFPYGINSRMTDKPAAPSRAEGCLRLFPLINALAKWQAAGIQVRAC